MKSYQHTFYTLLLCLYQLQGTLYPSGSILSRGLMLITLALSFYYFLKVNTSYKLNPVLASLDALVILFLIYGTIRAVTHTDVFWMFTNSSTDYLKNHMSSILPIFSYYYFTKKGLLTEQWFKAFSFVFFIIVALSYFREESYRLEDSFGDEVVINASYKWVALLPILVFFKNKPVLQYSLLLIILYFVLTGMKRGAIVIAALSSLVFIWNSLRTTRRSRRLFLFVLLGVFFTVGIHYLEVFISSSSFFAERVEDTLTGDASGREVIYPVYFDYLISQKNILDILLGKGADATIRYLGLLAHQDWLEIGIDLGFVGLCAYLWYWISIVGYWARVRRSDSDAAVFMGIFIIIYFTKSLISMSINNMVFYSTSVLGYYLAKTDSQKSI